MLLLQDSTDRPESFTGRSKVIKHHLGAIGFRYIPFNLGEFLHRDKYEKLMAWCKDPKRQYSIVSNFVCFVSNSEKKHWDVEFLFTSSFRMGFQNKSFILLITEIENFVENCC